MTDLPGLRLVPGDGTAGRQGARSETHPPGYFGVEEAAAFLATTPKGIYALVARREIPYRRLGRRLLFNPSELQDCLDKTRVAPLDASGEDPY